MRFTFFLLAIILFKCNYSQSFLNGSFEDNGATADAINLGNLSFDGFMNNCYAFGTFGNLDIITSPSYCNIAAQDGGWYVALTGGGTDAFSMKLSSPLDSGQIYKISYYDKFCNHNPGWCYYPIQIGLSDSCYTFGSVIYTSSNFSDTLWEEKTFSFVAPNNGQYVTITVLIGDIADGWVQVDNFRFIEPTNINDSEDHEAVLYPNPTHGGLYLSSKITFVEIFDINGVRVKKGKSQYLDLGDLENGIYIVKIVDSKKIYYEKIVKQ